MFRPSVNEEPVVFESQNSVSLFSFLENFPNRLKGKRKCASEPSNKSNKKPKIGNSKISGIFVGYAKLPSEMKEEKDLREKGMYDEVASVESMKEVEKKL